MVSIRGYLENMKKENIGPNPKDQRKTLHLAHIAAQLNVTADLQSHRELDQIPLPVQDTHQCRYHPICYPRCYPAPLSLKSLFLTDPLTPC